MSVKIAKSGGNVLTQQTKDLSMTTDANSPIIYVQGVFSIPINPGQTKIGSVPHGLGRIPRFRVNGQNDPAQSYQFLYPNASGGVLSMVYADSTMLYIKLMANGFIDPGTIKGYFFIF